MNKEDKKELKDPRINSALQQLASRIGTVFRRRGMDNHTFRITTEIIEDHARWCKREGIKFPALVPMVLTGVREIKLFRKDLEKEGIQSMITTIAKECPNVTAMEIAGALRLAYPGYRPSADAVRIATASNTLHLNKAQ